MKKHSRVYLWMLSFLRPYLVISLLFLLTGFVANIVQISVPKFIQVFVDDVLPTKETGGLFSLIGLLVVLIILMLFAKAYGNILQTKVTERTLRDIQLSVFKHLRHLGFSYFDKHTTGSTLSLFTTEMQAITSLYRRYLPWAIQMFIMVFFALVMTFYINVLLSLYIIPALLIYYMFGAYFAKKAAQTAVQVRDDRREVEKKVYDGLSAMTELRAYAREKWDFQRYERVYNKFKASAILEMLWLQCRGSTRKSLIHLSTFAVIVHGIFLVRSEAITVGEFIAFIFYYDILISQMCTLITNLTEQRVLLYQVERVYDIVKSSPLVKESDNPVHIDQIKGNIQFNGIKFSYNDQPVLQSFNLHVKQGEKVAIVGSSGSGKSTLLKLLGRFYDPQAGAITLDGIPIDQLSFETLRGSLGYVFQETYMFGNSVMENIRFGRPDAADEEVMDAARAAYAHDFIEKLPEGYNTSLGERGVILSGGQKQRISIARMFLRNPKIILLDEATSALDNISESEVHNALNSLMNGRTTLTIAHRLSTIEHYDKIVVIDEGVNAEMGSYKELIQNKQRFFHLSGEVLT